MISSQDSCQVESLNRLKNKPSLRLSITLKLPLGKTTAAELQIIILQQRLLRSSQLRTLKFVQYVK